MGGGLEWNDILSYYNGKNSFICGAMEPISKNLEVKLPLYLKKK